MQKTDKMLLPQKKKPSAFQKEKCEWEESESQRLLFHGGTQVVTLSIFVRSSSIIRSHKTVSFFHTTICELTTYSSFKTGEFFSKCFYKSCKSFHHVLVVALRGVTQPIREIFEPDYFSAVPINVVKGCSHSFNHETFEPIFLNSRVI